MIEGWSFSWKVCRLFKKLKSDTRAAILPMFALMFAAMLAFLGLLFDGGRMYFEKRRMQVAADAGSRGGAFDLRRFGTGSSFIDSAGKDDAELNGFTHGADGVNVTINNPPGSGNFAGNFDCVEAIVSKSFPTTLMRIASATGYTVATRAVACVAPDDRPACVISMYCGTEETGMRFNGKAQITATNCKVAVNSQADPSILFNGGGNCGPGGEAIILNGDEPGIVAYGGDAGGTLINNGSNYCIDCSQCPNGEAVSGMNFYPDPYCENIQPDTCSTGVPTYPASYPDACMTTDEEGAQTPFPDPTPPSSPVFTINSIIRSKDTEKSSAKFPDCTTVGGPSSPTQPCVDLTGPVLQLPQGYYAGNNGISMNRGNVNLVCDPDLAEGCVFFTDQLSINGGTFTGENVTIYVTETGSNASAIKIGANSTVNLSAPADASATYQNLVLFNSRQGSRDCDIQAGSGSLIVGAIYCPTGFLDFGGNSTFDFAAEYAAIIGYQIQFHGNPQVNVSLTEIGGISSQFSDVRLVE